MPRSKRSSNHCSEGTSSSGSGSGGTGTGTSDREFDSDIIQLTKLRSRPSKHMSGRINGKCDNWVSPVKMLAAREGNYSTRSKFAASDGCHVVSRYLPVNGPFLVDQMESSAYVSQFSPDGSLLVAGCQGSRIRVYNVENGWKVHKDIMAKSLRWTITDTCLSPDQRFLIYSSMSPVVHIVNVESGVKESLANVTEIHEGLNFAMENDDRDEYISGIFSVKFSTDGREIVAASSDSAIYVYDLSTNQCTLRLFAHEDDVNTVCFADESGHLMYSGSDDTFCKVWDRRCLNARGRPAGTLVGHLEGITFIDSRGDGRYLISNGKDQTIKLWDIRKMSSNSKASSAHRNHNWDYRWMEYPAHRRKMKHPKDQSVETYRGHSVLRTLIRCHFSPEFSTGQKYIYTGSNDGAVYIYDLVSGDVVAKLDNHEDTVRDCSWHPYYPTLVSSSWDTMIVRCEYTGDPETPSPIRRRTRRRRQIV
ncbi:LEC14B homolog [Silene latifolia]|uniref:LEC14B homolog n=1 Tax=Silene latifolia TaxID=37657 RepID=UPI003D780617